MHQNIVKIVMTQNCLNVYVYVPIDLQIIILNASTKQIFVQLIGIQNQNSSISAEIFFIFPNPQTPWRKHERISFRLPCVSALFCSLVQQNNSFWKQYSWKLMVSRKTNNRSGIPRVGEGERRGDESGLVERGDLDLYARVYMFGGHVFGRLLSFSVKLQNVVDNQFLPRGASRLCAANTVFTDGISRFGDKITKHQGVRVRT
jgi:hypothetical protein